MATFAEIQQRVRNHVIDLPTETEGEIPGWVNRAIRFAQEVHNFRFMEATAPFTTVEDTRKLGDIPDDWKEKRADPWLLEGDGGTMEIRWLPSESEAVRRYSETDANETGPPRHILETPDELHVYPFPDTNSLHSDGDYRVRVPYWKYLPELEADGDTNWFTDNAADYVVWKAAAEGMLFNRDFEMASLWAVKAGEFDANTGRMTGELARLVRVDKRSRLSRRITLVPHRDVYAVRDQLRGM